MPPPGGETITGAERLGWGQRATNSAELATFRYAVYVDGARSEMEAVTCEPNASGGQFACSGKLPPLTRGNHTLELAAFVVDGTVFESARSSPLQVTVEPASASNTPPSIEERRMGTNGRAGASGDDAEFVTDTIVEGLTRPTDIAVAPDRRLFVADAAGRIHAIEPKPDANSNTAADAQPIADAESVLAVALDPDFMRTRYLFALYVQRSGEGRSFVVARFREAAGTLGDRAILMGGVSASADPTGSIRFGPDGKLYVALDDGGDADLPADVASPNGKVLRLNTDGTTPDDQAAASPTYALPFASSRGFDWDRKSGLLWIADGSRASTLRLSAVAVSDAKARRGVTKTTVPFGDVRGASALAFYADGPIAALRNSLLVASPTLQGLLQVRVDANDRMHVTATERLLRHRGALHAVVVGSDGAVYVATDREIVRLTN